MVYVLLDTNEVFWCSNWAAIWVLVCYEGDVHVSVYLGLFWEDGMGWAVRDSSIVEHFLFVYRILSNFFSALGLPCLCVHTISS
jgi:hypothetical protein